MSPRPTSPATDFRAAVTPPACASCGDALTQINMVIDGSPLTMRSCSQCDTRSWHRGEDPVDLGGVLADISAKPTRYRRDLTVS